MCQRVSYMNTSDQENFNQNEEKKRAGKELNLAKKCYKLKNYC